MAAFKLILLDEAKKFLDNIPQNAHKKVLYNMWRVSGGEKNIELFKKLEKSEIWEFRTLYNGIAYRLLWLPLTESLRKRKRLQAKR